MLLNAHGILGVQAGVDVKRTSSTASVKEWDSARTMPMCMVSPPKANTAAQRQSTLRSFRRGSKGLPPHPRSWSPCRKARR